MISRRTIAVFLVLVLVPFLFSTIVMIREVGANTLAQALAGHYVFPPGHPYNPIPRIVLRLSAFSVLLALIGMMPTYLSRRMSFARLPSPLRLTSQVLMALLTAIIFRYATGFFMPLVWLPEFGDYLLGLPGSQTALQFSWYVVLPVTIVAVLLGPLWLKAAATTQVHRS